MVTRPPSCPRLAPCRASPHAVPRLRRPLIKMPVLVSIGCPAHFGEQPQQRALAAAAKYRHVTLVFTPSDGPRSDMRARKVGQQPSLPSRGWSSARGPQMARKPFQGPSEKTNTQQTGKLALISAAVDAVGRKDASDQPAVTETEPKPQDGKQAESGRNRPPSLTWKSARSCGGLQSTWRRSFPPQHGAINHSSANEAAERCGPSIIQGTCCLPRTCSCLISDMIAAVGGRIIRRRSLTGAA